MFTPQRLSSQQNISWRNSTTLPSNLKLCMKTSFTFHCQPCEQIKGTIIGLPISRFIAEIVLQKLEAAAFKIQKPSFWVRYVGDIFAINKSGRQADFKAHLNSIFTDIQFTMEKKNDRVLSFLNVLVRRRDDGGLTTSVFRKTSNTLQMLFYESNHPQAHSISCVKPLTK